MKLPIWGMSNSKNGKGGTSMGKLYRHTVAGSEMERNSPFARAACMASVAAATLLAVTASSSTAYAAGATIGYSAPFLMAQFEVILQDRSVAAAKAAGLTVLAPTNADQDSGKQITDIRNLVGAGA